MASISQLKDISSGGVCFTTNEVFSQATQLHIEIKIPYLGKSIGLDGYVTGVNEKVPNILYEVHVAFDKPSREVKAVLDGIIKEYKEKTLVEERRQYLRIKKHFVITYFDQTNPSVRHEVTQIKNISKGGACIITSMHVLPGSRLTIELKTPHMHDLTALQGIVLGSHERIHNIVYETRVQFENLSEQAVTVLNKIEEIFKKEDA